MTMRAAAAVLSVLALSCVYACKSQSRPRAQLHALFDLPCQQTVSVAETPLQITFTKLISDSRCPAGMTCVWAGEVVVELKVTSGTESVSIELGTHRTRQREVTALGYRIMLEDLSPHRSMQDRVEQSQYSVSLKVTPASQG